MKNFLKQFNMITIVISALSLVSGFLIGYFWEQNSVTIRISEMKPNGDKPVIETKGKVKVIIESSNIKS